MERAKDFEGVLAILAEATAALRENHLLLSRDLDDTSRSAAHRTKRTLDSVEFLGRDLAAGLVDLEAVPFDQAAHTAAFADADLILASEPDRRRSSGGRRAEDEPAAIELTEVVRPVPSEREAFDFNAEFEFKSAEQHVEECEGHIPQPHSPSEFDDFPEFPEFQDPGDTIPMHPDTGDPV